MKVTIEKPGLRRYLQNEHDLNAGSDVYDAADGALKETLPKAADRHGCREGSTHDEIRDP